MDWKFTYPSQRMPVMAANVVASSQPLASQAGLQALIDGGTAADAAICTAITLTVVEPVVNGIGSDAFAIYWDGGVQGVNGSGRSPAGQPRSAFADAKAMPRLGWGAVTVPGCVSVWAGLHKKCGRLPFERLFEPAIRYARDGYPVSPMTASSWRRSVQRYKDFPAWMATFAPEGKGPATGEVVRLPDHAVTLAEIAKTGGESFYRGALAARIEEAACADKAAMRATDLAAHEPLWIEPWTMDYHGITLHEIPPNSQGVAALIALGILGNIDMKEMAVDGAESVHVQVEAMKAALADLNEFVADPELGVANARRLLERDYLKERAAKIDRNVAATWAPRELPKSDTVYLCAADAEGHMVSYIQSNYEGFGSGVVIPGTGISMQNRGACFSLKPGHANEYAPGKRPLQTIIPAFLTKDGSPLSAFGVMGGAMQPQGHVQVVIRLVDQQLNPQSALDAPRWQVLENGTLALERGFSADTIAGLKSRGHKVQLPGEGADPFFGGAQMAYRNGSTYIAASDPRRDGQAVGK